MTLNTSELLTLNRDLMSSHSDMTEQQWRELLTKEGFKTIEVGTDPAGMEYPPHKHDTYVEHVILAGEMTLTIEGETSILKVGDRSGAPAGAMHSAKIGPQGCTYLIGEK
jgi:quercetin dioxygenase-like cupin family protein